MQIEKNSHKYDFVALGLIVLFMFLYSLISIIKHNHFQTGLDLAVYVQSMWYYTHFLIPHVTFKPINGDVVFADHFTPTLVLLAPLFRVWQDAKLFLIIQSLFFVLGAYPIYIFAKDELKHSLVAISLALTYLIFYATQYALTFDFHPATFAASFLPWIFYALFKRRWNLFIMLGLLAAGCQEDFSLYIAVLGGYLLLTGKNRRVGFLLMLSMLLYFYSVVYYVMPSFRHNFETPTATPILSLYSLNLANIFFNSWVKIHTMLVSFGYLLFLPLLSGSFLLLPLAHFYINYAVPGLEGRWDVYLHYHSQLAAILIFASIIGYRNLIKKNLFFETRLSKSVVAVMILSVSFFFDYQLHLPINTLAKPNFYKNEAWMGDLVLASKQVPENASVMTTQQIFPHLAFRKEIKFYNYSISGEDAFQELAGIDYVVLDTRPNQSVGDYWYSFGNYKELEESVDTLLNQHLFYIYFQKNNALVLKRVV